MKIMAVVFLIFTSCSYTNQVGVYFEGKIVYRNSAKSKSPNFTPEEVLGLSGDSSVFYFKQGNYRQVYSSKNLKEEFFDRANNLVFTRENNTDTFFKRNVSIPGEKIEEYKLNKNKERVLGILCDELILRYKSKTITYYYNSDSLKIDPKWFEHYTDFNKNFTSERMRSLFLKCRLEYPEVIFEIIATSIYHERVSDNFLKLPDNAIVVERPAN
jgi:hypothetical protein